MVMRRVAVLAALLLCGLQLSPTTFSAPPSAAPTLSAQEMNFTLEGKITDKSPGKLTVSSGENMIFHVLYNEKTEIKKKDGSAGTAQDLRIGLRISVAGDLAESGEITAKKIEIEGDGSGEH
jgi:ABC-type transport system substrate-binding protein